MITSDPGIFSPEQTQTLNSRIAGNNEINLRSIQKRQTERVGRLAEMTKAQRLKIDLLIDAVLRKGNQNDNIRPGKTITGTSTNA